MGIAIPRPAMRGRERRTIENRLRLHAEFTRRLVAEGMTNDEASRKAFFMVKAGGKWIEPKDRQPPNVCPCGAGEDACPGPDGKPACAS